MEPGRVIGGKYELATLVGRGSMGEVWRARHLALGEELAVKLLNLSPASGGMEDPATASARFRFEARVAARLSRRTRHIVCVTDHGEDGSSLAYLAMELLEGRTLERRLLFGEMSPDEVCPVVAQIARALACAHAERVVHRDLKPANVFLARDEDGGLLVKVLDFGIARATRTQRLGSPFSTGDGIVFGTPGYMSPEHAFGAVVDERADLWALATLAYEALTGALPLPGNCALELQRNLLLRRLVPVHDRDDHRLPAGLAEFFQRAFAQRIEDRFASASELASSFEQAVVVRSRASERTAPMLARLMVQGDTLPMALDPSPRSTPRSSQTRTAWLRLAVAVPFMGLPALVAARMLRVPTLEARAPASSIAAAPTEGGSTAAAPPPEEPRATQAGPSVTGRIPPAPDTGADAPVRRATRAAPAGSRPVSSASAATPEQTSRRPPSVAPVPTPLVAPALRPPTDAEKSATL